MTRLFGYTGNKKYRKTRLFGYRKPQEWENANQDPKKLTPAKKQRKQKIYPIKSITS